MELNQRTSGESEMDELLIDAMGIPLAEHHRWLPDRVALWPTPKKIVDKDAAVLWKVNAYRKSDQRCWWCHLQVAPAWRPEDLEVHHMCRIPHHDAPWNFALLCSTCHRHVGEAVKAASLPRLLVLKHQYDREHTSWIHLAIGLGRFLPVEEEVDKETWRMVLDAADERSNFGTY